MNMAIFFDETNGILLMKKRLFQMAYFKFHETIYWESSKLTNSKINTSRENHAHSISCKPPHKNHPREYFGTTLYFIQITASVVEKSQILSVAFHLSVTVLLEWQRAVAELVRIPQPSTNLPSPWKHYSGPFPRRSSQLWKRFYVSCIIPFLAHRVWSRCAPRTPHVTLSWIPTISIAQTHWGLYGQGDLEKLYPIQHSRVLELLDHEALATVTTLLSSLSLSPCLPPSVILSSPLSFFKFYLFPSFFVRGHHPIQPAVYHPVVTKGTLSAVPAMLDRLMLIHTSQHYHDNQLYSSTTSYSSFVTLSGFSGFFDLFDFWSHGITRGQGFPKRLYVVQAQVTYLAITMPEPSQRTFLGASPPVTLSKPQKKRRKANKPKDAVAVAAWAAAFKESEAVLEPAPEPIEVQEPIIAPEPVPSTENLSTPLPENEILLKPSPVVDLVHKRLKATSKKIVSFILVLFISLTLKWFFSNG